MQRRLSTLLTFTIVAARIGLFAESASDLAGHGPLSPSVAEISSDMTVRLSGVIESYDKTSRVLTLATSKGSVQFVVPPVARVRQDKKTAVISDLGSFIGCR